MPANHPLLNALKRPAKSGADHFQAGTKTTRIDRETALGPGNNSPMEVDLGCGKGRFLVARAQADRDTFFMGIDRRNARILKVEKKVSRLGLTNVSVIRSEILCAVETRLPENSVSAYYLFFPDPWPKRRHHRRRLFDARFLDAIQLTLRKNGKIHIATDHLDYFAKIRAILSSDSRFKETEPFVPAKDEQTDFELIFLSQNKPIGRCSFMKP